MTSEFQLTGKHVLAALIGFFLVIMSVNFVFLNLALKTFPGEKEEKSYLQGLNYNDRLDARDQQALLGWRASIEEAALNGDTLKLTVIIQRQDGAAMSGLDVSGVLSRPANAAQDQPFVFTETGIGEYSAALSAGAGVWDLAGIAKSRRGDEFEFTSRMVLK